MKKISLILLTISATYFAKAATFNIPNGDVAALVAAITTANSNGQTDTIILALNGTYNFSTISNTVTGQPFGYRETEGPNALPIIANDNLAGLDIVFNLNGSVLQLVGTTKMRLFYGSNDCSWELNNGSIKNFESPVDNPIVGRGGGGGAVVTGERNIFKSNNMTFENCKSNSVEERSGAAIYSKGDGDILLENSIYKNNIGSTYGGAVTILLCDIVVRNCTFDNNICTVGGGAALYVDGCKGPVAASGGIGKIENCTFVNNTSPSFGAVFLQGYFQDNWFVKNSQFTGNKATANGGMAGALWHSGSNNVGNSLFDVSNCTFENNEAKTHGGAVTCTRGSNNFTNCTFVGNITKDAGGLGGGIYNISDVGFTFFATISNCTFANNIAGGYGGAWCITNNQGSVHNTIVSNNKAYQQCGYPPAAGCIGYNNANNCAGLLSSTGVNIEFPERNNVNDVNDRPCFARVNILNSGTFPVINPLLLPLAANGGPTKTMALQPTSPAINAGNGCTLLDQRGAARIGACDLGAFEFNGTLSAAANFAEISNIKVYPNPSTDFFTIKVPSAFEVGELTIFSIDGKLILSQTLHSSSTNIKLQEPGIYILKTSIDNKTTTQKIIKI